MLILRCTRKLLVRLKQPGVGTPADSTTRLGDWYGTLLRVRHAQYLLFISERSRLPVVLPARDAKRLDTLLPERVCQVLDLIGIPADDIAAEREAMSQIVFAPTRNRNVVGTLTDFVRMARYGRPESGEPETPWEMMNSLAISPILTLGGASPIALTRALFGRP